MKIQFDKHNMFLRSFLVIVLLSTFAKADFDLPYTEDFNDLTIGNTFEDWTYPFGTIYGPESSPFGVTLPFDRNYLFVTGSQGHSSIIEFSETTKYVKFNCDFYSLPNPQYDPGSGAFMGGAQFLIRAADYIPPSSRNPQIGIEIDAEMWLDGEYADVLFRADYMGDYLWSTKIGTIKHDNLYHLSIVFDNNIFLVDISGDSQNISYEYLIDQQFMAKDILFWEGSYPGDQYGVGIDNINIIPEPNSFLFSIMMGVIILRRKR